MIDPQKIGINLTNINQFANEYLDAVKRVIRDLITTNKKPEEFNAQIEKRGDGMLIFHLWHESAFLPENRDVIGNPGGQCFDIVLDAHTYEIKSREFWQ